MNKDLEEKYKNLIEYNINAGKTHDGKEFLILVSSLFAVCLLVYTFAGGIANFFIDRMTPSQQTILETVLASPIAGRKPLNNFRKLENIKSEIIKQDKSLQGKSKFPLYWIPDKEINAFVTADGSIYFTKGLLLEIKDEEMLAFVLAHEMGHYAHKDHLKTIGRELLAAACLSVISQNDVGSTVKTMTGVNSLRYSQKQEKNADLYANKMVYKLYGRNTGGVKFFKYLESKEKMPEFLYYFSTHPSTKERLKLIK